MDRRAEGVPSVDLTAVADGAMTWKLERRTPAVVVASSIHATFRHVLYRVGISGASTVTRPIMKLFGNAKATFVNPMGARFAFPAWDSYFGHYLYPGKQYEPELAGVLAACSVTDRGAFLDCGANYGYWSSLAAPLLKGQVVAVELDRNTTTLLQHNANLNKSSFKVINAAIWDSDGVSMSVAEIGSNQEFHAEIADASKSADKVVISRSIDSLVQEHALVGADLVVKIDCEGAEIHAVNGAVTTAAAGATFILEDHGNDPSCRVSKHVLGLGWSVAIPAARGRWTVVTDVAQVKAIKLESHVGYNVLAWSGEPQPWVQAILA
jgi:FkbM family methyltransferase